VRVDLERFTTAVIGVVKSAMVGVVTRLDVLEKRLDALPTPKDGEQGPEGKTGPQGERGADGKDGRDGRDAQGIPGDRGEKGDVGPVGPSGPQGDRGPDGLGFDDLSVTYDGQRTFTVTFQRGDVVKAFPFRMPVVLYRGIYDQSTTYEAGDAVTWGGSMWIARTDTASVAPDENSVAGKKVWALSVMRGRAGKQGTKGDTGDRGPMGQQGIPGRNGFNS
jgi:hypothetical protein